MFRVIACLVTKQQLGQAWIGELPPIAIQRLTGLRSHAITQQAIFVTQESLIKLLLGIGCLESFTGSIQFAQFGRPVGLLGNQRPRASQIKVHVQTKTFLIFRAQHTQWRYHGTPVDMQQLQGHRQLPCHQGIAPEIKTPAEFIRIFFKQGRRIAVQIAHDKCIAIDRMPGQGQGDGKIVTLGRIAP